jgi:hypothetical protein
MSIHNHRKRNAEAQQRGCQKPAYRIQKQIGITRTNPEDRAQEQVGNTARRRIACMNLENRAQEQVTNTAQRQNACTNLENRAQEQVTNTAQKDWQENNLVFWRMRHYNDGK